MSQFGHRARSLFDRMFPERQIYHRSGGTVRYVSLSPGKQALLALSGIPEEERSLLYLVRLVAFAIILASVWRANRRA